MSSAPAGVAYAGRRGVSRYTKGAGIVPAP